MSDYQAIETTENTVYSYETAAGRTKRQTWLMFPEKLLIVTTLAIGFLSYVLASAHDQIVAWDKFLISFLPAALLLCLGCFLRAYKDMPRLAQGAIAMSIYVGFSGVIAIFIYLRFPISTPVIDPLLTRIDAAFGYSWPGFVYGLAEFPKIGQALSYVYASSLPQLMCVIFILSFLGRSVELHRVLLTGVISLLLAVLFWWAFPSFGPSPYTSIAPDVEAALRLSYDEVASLELLRMAQYGNAVIAPEMIMGTIAFPSYHTVMACLAVWFLARTWFFWPSLALNTAMVPAILAHGGHHLSDVFGGFLAFAIALWISTKILHFSAARP
jgi:hypothetical protein